MHEAFENLCPPSNYQPWWDMRETLKVDVSHNFPRVKSSNVLDQSFEEMKATRTDVVYTALFALFGASKELELRLRSGQGCLPLVSKPLPSKICIQIETDWWETMHRTTILHPYTLERDVAEKSEKIFSGSEIPPIFFLFFSSQFRQPYPCLNDELFFLKYSNHQLLHRLMNNASPLTQRAGVKCPSCRLKSAMSLMVVPAYTNTKVIGCKCVQDQRMRLE